MTYFSTLFCNLVRQIFIIITLLSNELRIYLINLIRNLDKNLILLQVASLVRTLELLLYLKKEKEKKCKKIFVLEFKLLKTLLK